MKPLRIARDSAGELRAGLVLAQAVRSPDGIVALDKGRVLSGSDVGLLRELEWPELHLVELEAGDLHEREAGRRLARAVAGDNVEAGELVSGAVPLTAKRRGLLVLDAKLDDVNELPDVVVYTQPHWRVVLEGEVVARAKIVPFVTAAAHIERAEQIGAALRVRPFASLRVSALVLESLPPQKLARFRDVFAEKLRFFGSELFEVRALPNESAAIAAALRETIARGAQLVAMAGGKPMDPLDATLQALAPAGAQLEKNGVPAHPGTLSWLAYAGAVPIIGMPSCGVFSRATVFDLILPRLLAGERLSRRDLAAFGAGGMLTREQSHRFPPYREDRARGELDEA